MRERIGGIRARIDYRAQSPSNEIGCILLAQPTFFRPDEWVPGPRDWPRRTYDTSEYDLTVGEGSRIWEECLARADARPNPACEEPLLVREDSPRYGTPQLVAAAPRPGNLPCRGDGRVLRACAVTQEHSLPALEASHIQPYAKDGPHEVRNGSCCGPTCIGCSIKATSRSRRTTASRSVHGSRRIIETGDRTTHYTGPRCRCRRRRHDAPSADYLRWHNERVYRGA